MDAVSYSHSAKQAQRIEKFIKNPDSNSGIVTVPKVIGAGESVTVPAGRVAVLPNVQVDGTLNVEGEVFIPSGSGLSTVVQKSGDTMTGNLNFASGTKITGDFSSATLLNKTSIQTNVVNGTTALSVLPNGTAATATINFYNNSDPTNAAAMLVGVGSGGTEARVASIVSGTGTYLPMTFSTGGSERMRIDTSGNVGIGTSSPVARLHNISSASGGGAPATSGGVDGNIGQRFQTGSVALDFGHYANGVAWIQNRLFNSYDNNYAIHLNPNGGNVLVTGSGALGYGTGSGGTVTQLTSRSTSVTIDKPVGNIILFTKVGAALEFFQVFNNKVSSNDTIQCSVKLGAVNAYSTYVFNVTNGAFYIAVSTNGTSIDTPIINFSIIKGANS